GLPGPGKDLERLRIDNGKGLVVGRAQPDLAAAGVDIAPLEVVADLDPPGDRDAGGVDAGERALALLLDPHRAFTRGEKPRHRAERDRVGYGVGRRVDALERPARAADGPQRVEAKG